MNNWLKALRDFWRGITAKDKKAPLYLAALAVVGAALMLTGGWPVLTGLGSGPAAETETINEEEAGSGGAIPAFADKGMESGLYERERGLEKRLEEAFALVENVGDVRVVVSLTHEKETVYAADKNTDESQSHETDAQGGSRVTSTHSSQEETVIITDSAGVDRPLVLREIEPKIAGVVIIAEGGDSVFVQDALTKAACTVLEVEANKVQVLKMKEGE